MARAQDQDFYEVLQVSPRAHPLMITKAFRLLAALYHPDNKGSGSEELFKQLGHAYRILSDPVRRAAYDRERTVPAPSMRVSPPTRDDESTPAPAHRDVDELELRFLVLRALYDVRRGRPYKPSLSLLVLSELVGCSIECLQYTLWYLRGKRFIENADDSEVAITVDGVDHVEAARPGANGPGAHYQVEAPMALPFPRAVAVEWALQSAANSNGDGSDR